MTKNEPCWLCINPFLPRHPTPASIAQRFSEMAELSTVALYLIDGQLSTNFSANCSKRFLTKIW